MKVLHKLKALFVKNKQPVALDLVAAEIKNGRAYLHPKENREITYMVRSDDIEIYLNRERGLSEDDIITIPRTKVQINTQKAKPKSNSPKKPSENTNPVSSDSFERFKKKTFSVTMYQHEYDALISTIKEYGYRRADFILASANTATKGTMEREHKKLIKVHKEMRKEEKTAKINQKNS